MGLTGDMNPCWLIFAQDQALELDWYTWVRWILWLALGFFAVFPGIVAYMVWLERKVAARFQDRIGPNRVGPYGLLQPIADGLKFFFKEDIIPSHVEKLLYLLAPDVTSRRLTAFNAWLRSHGHLLLTVGLLAAGAILIVNGALGLAVEVGGRARPAIEQYIFFDEVQRAGFPIPFLTLCTVGPTLLKYGPEEKKARSKGHR